MDFNTRETSFHSLRHVFRDALRAAQISTSIAKALGGWSASSVSEQYGAGYPIDVLKKNIEKIHFDLHT